MLLFLFGLVRYLAIDPTVAGLDLHRGRLLEEVTLAPDASHNITLRAVPNTWTGPVLWTRIPVKTIRA